MIARWLSFALVFALPWAASAQVTAHQVTIKLAGIGQMTNNEDLKPDKFSANWKDVFEACTGLPPERDQAIFLFIDCANLNSNMIAAMDTDPVALIANIGSVNLNLGDLVRNEKNGVLQSAFVPASVEIDCAGAAIEGFGILDVKFKDLEGEQCPNSASVKLVGTGEAEEAFIVGNGSTLNAKKRTAAFSNQFPPEP